ncbi:MAG: rhodanese-like domain-containing protein [Geminicoccaceae bacterium]
MGRPGIFGLLALGLALSLPGHANEPVNLTAELPSVTVETADGPIEIRRNPDNDARVSDYYAQTSRPCPPFCLQPMVPVPGVVPIGELELLTFLEAGEGVLIDARTEDWHLDETIPGAVNIPYVEITLRLDELGCTGETGAWDCSAAKPVCLFCNGPWCGQSPTAIRAMVRAGYPPEKIHYYRAGMQGWNGVGLTTVAGSL